MKMTMKAKQMRTLDRYELRELERLVEKERVKLRELEKNCDLSGVEFYEFILAIPADSNTAAAKDWHFVRRCAVKLEIIRLRGKPDNGVCDILPSSVLPLDAFPFGDRSL
jgi:hypothetical protein